MYLYHYYDSTIGPFKSLTAISPDEARAVLEEIKVTKPNSQSATRHDKYVQYRRNCDFPEWQVRFSVGESSSQ